MQMNDVRVNCLSGSFASFVLLGMVGVESKAGSYVNMDCLKTAHTATAQWARCWHSAPSTLANFYLHLYS